jgi:hypothetical protein
VLPDHRDEALVGFGKRGAEYLCPSLGSPLGLAQVRAAQAYASVPYYKAVDESSDPAWRRVRPPRSPVELARWLELLDFEAGLLEPRPVALLMPADLSPRARAVADGIRLLLGLRDESIWYTSTFTFGRRFCCARCGLSGEDARRAIEELRNRKVIVAMKKAHGGALEYRLGEPAEVGDAPIRAEDLIDPLKVMFAAIEMTCDPPGRTSSDGPPRARHLRCAAGALANE